MFKMTSEQMIPTSEDTGTVPVTALSFLGLVRLFTIYEGKLETCFKNGDQIQILTNWDKKITIFRIRIRISMDPYPAQI